MKKESLLGVQLDDEVFLNVEVDIAALRQLGDNTLQAAGFAAQPGRLEYCITGIANASSAATIENTIQPMQFQERSHPV